MANLSVNMRAVVLVLVSFLSYNCGDAFVKQALNFYYFAEAAFYPTLFYALIVLIFHKKFGGFASLFKTKYKKYHFLRGLGGTGCYLSFAFSIQYITLAETYTLLLTSPFWIAILSIFFFKEFIGFHRWTAIVCGFFGVLIVIRPGLISIEPASLLMLLGACGFAFFVIYTKKIGDQEPLINMVIYPILVEAMVLGPLIVWNGFLNEGFSPPAIHHIPFFTLAGLFFLIGTSLSSLGFSSGESSLLAPLHYSQIIWGTLIGFFFFAEIPELWTMVGSMVIVISGIYLIYREHKAHHIMY
jgi:S-adenosylmethionine uptake transporter